MHSAIFLDIPNIIKIKSKQAFPLHREDWLLSDEIKDIIAKHVNLNYKVFLVGNYPNIPVRKRESNPIENLFTSIAEALEKEFKLETNSINFDYATDVNNFDYLPLPGMFYNLAAEHEILLGYSFIITTSVLARYMQMYSSIKPIIL
jgi:histidinol phosphatase-like enzyme